jgi:hypothetical protein
VVRVHISLQKYVKIVHNYISTGEVAALMMGFTVMLLVKFLNIIDVA